MPIAVASAAVCLLMLSKAIPLEPWRLRVPSCPIPGFNKGLIYPVGAVNYLAAHRFRGNVFVPYDWGSYVMWKLGPAVQISSDSRYEVAYPAWRLEEDHDFFAAHEGWSATGVSS